MVNMPNPYFQFKQFTVQQAVNAMKVTTDACILGALANEWVRTHGSLFVRGLDVGAGTGLLSLMLAQDTPLKMDAVEIDFQAAAECAANVLESPFADRIMVHAVPIEDFPVVREAYDIIICNPPFFKSSLPSPDAGINRARHEDGLSINHLLKEINVRLQEQGIAFVLMPANRDEAFRASATQENLHIDTSWYVQHTDHHKPFRVIYQLRKDEAVEIKRTLIIRDNHNAYTNVMYGLMEPFYLHC